MRFYTVHSNPARKDVDQRIILVKEGFAWMAFVLPLLWLIYRRVWIALPLYFAGAIGLFAILFYGGFDPLILSAASGALLLGMPLTLLSAPNVALALLAFMFALLCGFEAHDLRRFHLKRRGYQLIDVVAARNEAEAERSYFSERPQSVGLSGGPAAPASGMRTASMSWEASEPITGLFNPADLRDNRHP